ARLHLCDVQALGHDVDQVGLRHGVSGGLTHVRRLSFATAPGNRSAEIRRILARRFPRSQGAPGTCGDLAVLETKGGRNRGSDPLGENSSYAGGARYASEVRRATTGFCTGFLVISLLPSTPKVFARARSTFSSMAVDGFPSTSAISLMRRNLARSNIRFSRKDKLFLRLRNVKPFSTSATSYRLPVRILS